MPFIHHCRSPFFFFFSFLSSSPPLSSSSLIIYFILLFIIIIIIADDEWSNLFRIVFYILFRYMKLSFILSFLNEPVLGLYLNNGLFLSQNHNWFKWRKTSSFITLLLKLNIIHYYYVTVQQYTTYLSSQNGLALFVLVPYSPSAHVRGSQQYWTVVERVGSDRTSRLDQMNAWLRV